MHVTSATKSGCSVLFFSMNQDNNYNGIHRNAIHGFTLVGLKLSSQSMYIYVSCDMFGSTMGEEENPIESNRIGIDQLNKCLSVWSMIFPS